MVRLDLHFNDAANARAGYFAFQTARTDAVVLVVVDFHVGLRAAFAEDAAAEATVMAANERAEACVADAAIGTVAVGFPHVKILSQDFVFRFS